MHDVPGNGVLYVGAPICSRPCDDCSIRGPPRRRARARAFVQTHCEWGALTDEFEKFLEGVRSQKSEVGSQKPEVRM